MKQKMLVITLIAILYSCSEKNPDVYRKNAENLCNENKLELALTEINKAIDIEPDSTLNYSYREFIYNLMGRYEDEISDLSKIIELNKSRNSKSLNAYHQRAVVRIQLGLFEEAMNDIDYYINNGDTVANLADAYLNKATILYCLNDIEESRKFYDLTIIENEKRDKIIESQAIVGLANLSKSNKEALTLLNKAIESDDENSTAYCARGSIFYENGSFENAYLDYKKAFILNPRDLSTVNNLGQIFQFELNNSDSAIYYYKKALSLSPNPSSKEIIERNLHLLISQR